MNPRGERRYVGRGGGVGSAPRIGTSSFYNLLARTMVQVHPLLPYLIALLSVSTPARIPVPGLISLVRMAGRMLKRLSVKLSLTWSAVAWIEACGRVKTRPSQNWALGRARVVPSDEECGFPSPTRPMAQLCEGRVLTRQHSTIKKKTRLLWLGFASGGGEKSHCQVAMNPMVQDSPRNTRDS
jgi:hypothetical protein